MSIPLFAFNFKTTFPKALKIPISQQCQFTEIYDIETDSVGHIFLATNAGIYSYNGYEINPICEEIHPTDYLQFIKSSNGKLYAMPYENKILQITYDNQNHIYIQTLPLPNTKQNYRAYYGYEDGAQNLHFLIKSNHHSIATYVLKKNTSTLLLEKTFNIAMNDKQDANLFFSQMLSHCGNTDTSINTFQNTITMLQKSIRSHQTLLLKNKIYQAQKHTFNLIYQNNNPAININRFYPSSAKNTFYIAEQNQMQSVYKISPTQKQLIFENREITGICEDPFHNVFIATRNDGLFKINQEELITNNYITNIIPPIIACHVVSPSLVFLADETGNLYQANLKHTTVQCILKTNNKLYIPPYFQKGENYTLLFANADGVFNISLNDFHVSKKIDDPFISASNYIKTISLANKNYIISKRRILQINGNQKIEFLPPNNITDADTFQHKIIVSSYKGIYWFNPFDSNATFTKININPSIDENRVKQIVSNQNTFFFQFNDAIYAYDGSSKKTTQIIKPTNERFQFFYVHQNNIIVIKEKAFCIFTTNGTLIKKYFLPLQNNDNEKIVATSLNDSLLFITLNNKFSNYNINLQKQISKQLYIIPNYIAYHKDTFLSIEQFTFSKNATLQINFDILNAQESDIFEYVVTNTDNEIIDKKLLFKDNSLSIFNLEPGNYTVSIYCLNKAYFSMSLTIDKAWYQTLLFKLGITCIAIMIFFGGTWYWIKRNEKIFQTNNALLRLESLSKTNQLKSHFIFNALVPLQNFILLKKNEQATEYLYNFSSLMRNILEMNHKTLISIADEITFLHQYLSVQQIKMSHSFTYSLLTDNVYQPLDQILIPTLIIQPIVENAINYGMQTDNGLIQVTFSEDIVNNLINVEIFDNGQGFSKQNYSDGKESIHALDIIEKRIAILRQNVNKFSSISYQNSENGFSVIIALPKNVTSHAEKNSDHYH